MKRIRYLLSLIVLCASIMACSFIDTEPTQTAYAKSKGSGQVATTQGSRGNKLSVLVPTASGTVVYGNGKASIDASNTTEGYVMVAYLGSNGKVRMLVQTPAGNTYNYLMYSDGQYHVYPLTEGNGIYKIGVYENISGDQYSVAFTQSINVATKDNYTMYLYPNAYVDFNGASAAVAKGAELATTANSDLDVVSNVYHYVTGNVKYDYNKAKTVQSGYVPNVDSTLATKKGICFDYASLMATMLRSQGIPTRLEIGYAGTEYHAWISVYTAETGWIDGVISFDGVNWSLMDPTLGSYASKNVVKQYRENATYYQLKYKY